MLRLVGAVQPYAWGDRSAIAELQGRAPDGSPEAELWLGAHPVAPASVDGAGTLDQVIAADPVAALGPRVAECFGQLPYLLKVLAAGEPLSIQAHPTKAQAEAGFARENAQGLATTDAVRTYRDDNHKPELICALTTFEAKCGFRAPEETARLVEYLVAAVPAPTGSLVDLERALSASDDGPVAIATALEWLLRLPAETVAVLVADLVTAAAECLDVDGHPALDSVAEAEAVLRWTVALDQFHPGDVGVVVALLLNHVTLAPGEAMFLSAGNLHAYLHGVGVELMANSDNVVRGGLTVKHIDVDELLAVVDPTPSQAPVQRPSGARHRYDSPVPEFALERLSNADVTVDRDGPDIVLVTSGSAVVETVSGVSSQRLASGESVFVAHGDGAYRITSAPGTVAWRAGVGPLA